MADTDIAAFLTARYDEDEEIARAATVDQQNGAHWQIGSITTREDYEFVDIHTAPPNAIEIAGAGFDATGGVHGGGFATHMVRHDPAHVLADIATKRAIIESEQAPYRPLRVQATRVMKLLTAPYAEHPDYDPSWALDA